MTTKLKSLAVPFLIAATALLVVPAAAQATLAYTRNVFHPVVYTAQDNGKGQKKIGPGRSPKVSPDGQLVAYEHESKPGKRELKLAAADGSGSETILKNLRNGYYVTFSPDSLTVAATTGPELGKEKLVLINVGTGSVRTVASGYFYGVSFSPDSSEIVYGRTASEKYPPHIDVYRAPVAAGTPVAITHDHKSWYPLWGPQKIVFAKLIGAKTRKYGPKNDLFLVNPDGTGVKRLTHTKVNPLTQGLFPTQWSDSGNQLLTEYGGQDTSYAVTVNPKTGVERVVGKAGEVGFVGTALSGDGTTILGFTGGFEPGPNHNVATTPYAGGKIKPLVKNAFEPDWSR